VIVKNKELGCKTYKKLGNLRPLKKKKRRRRIYQKNGLIQISYFD
jgi:hypothetical protein